MHDKILILDFGSQVTQLIARRVREANVYSEIHPYDVDASFIRDFAPKGVILSGGPSSVTETDTPRVPQAVFELGVPVLGICYGMQAMAEQLGGKVDIGHLREFGYAEVRAHGHTSLLERHRATSQTPEGHGMLKVWMSHGDKVLEMPPGFALMASTPNRARSPAMADEASLLRSAMAPGSHAHRARPRDARALRAEDLRRTADWDHGQLYRRSRREDSRAGG